MKYIDFAENERLSTIVLGMMRISELSEDEVEALVEAALSIGINTFDLAVGRSHSPQLCKFSCAL